MLNRDRILQGTAYKKISSAYKNMKENVIENAVETFYKIVSECSASEIMDNSEFIFAESGKSLDLYQNILESNCLPFYRYPEELEKLSSYVESNKDTITDLDKYNNILGILTEKVKDTLDLYVIETMTMMESSDPLKECDAINLYTDVLYKSKTNYNIDDRNLLESVASCMTDYSVILHTASVSSELGLEPMIMKSLRNVYTEKAGIENSNDWNVCLKTNMILEKMLGNETIAKNVSLSRNANYDKTFKGIAYESPIEIMGEIILENVTVSSNHEMSAFEAVNEMFSKETIEHILQEDTDYDEYEILCRKLDLYDTALEFVTMEYSLCDNPDNTPVPDSDFIRTLKEHNKLPANLSITEAMDLLIESCSILEAGKEAYEYTDDGRPSKIIAKTAGYVSQDNESLKTKSQKTSKAKYNTSIPSEKPKLEKPGMMERIQHKALDTDAKMKGLRSKTKQVAMNVKNTGKAILKIPANLINGWKDMVAKWDEMDDNRRTEFIIKPGFRKNYFKGFRTAIVYGGAAYANPLLVPVVWICRSLSKQKNMRIRNELTNELTTELKVIDSKIEEADKNGHSKEKWQLMRIRDKVDQERIRVTTNSKFV